jgi:hypothetical protein
MQHKSGWGGARVGAGKKPQPKPVSVIPGRFATPPVNVPDSDADLLVPPDDLPEDQRECWRLYAPLAIERQTLTQATVPAFRLLCELHAKKTMVSGMVDKGALGGLRVFMQLAKQVENLMGRFCLAPFGKAANPNKPKAAPNPWAQIAQR